MCLHEAGNSRQKEQHGKRAMSRYVVKFIEFLSQKRNRTVLMESTHMKKTRQINMVLTHERLNRTPMLMGRHKIYTSFWVDPLFKATD